MPTSVLETSPPLQSNHPRSQDARSPILSNLQVLLETRALSLKHLHPVPHQFHVALYKSSCLYGSCHDHSYARQSRPHCSSLKNEMLGLQISHVSSHRASLLYKRRP